ncbi:hypothetical protein D6764_03685 [Candidatus Woesearchaeota archaeon]|nr:MAG: hypothetical protein D6764_03685 [Candidatus Woesearchaeota archaeon]
MKGADWKECKENGTARKITPDVPRAKSLIETAEERISLNSEITPKNCNFVFEDYYTSLLELIQAMAFIKGYNILNHLCIGYYIRDVMRREDLHALFEDLRYKRNSLTYYGRRMDFETASESIEKCRRLIKEIKELLKKEEI